MKTPDKERTAKYRSKERERINKRQRAVTFASTELKRKHIEEWHNYYNYYMKKEDE